MEKQKKDYDTPKMYIHGSISEKTNKQAPYDDGSAMGSTND